MVKGPKAVVANLVPAVPREEGEPIQRWVASFIGGPVKELQVLEEAWRRIWQRPLQESPQEAGWWEYLGALPAMDTPAAWTGAQVRAAVAAMSARKAGGLDGWQVAEFKVLPLYLLEGLAALFNYVEQGGEWPDHVVAPEGVLLPKASGFTPLDRRPIWLLPVVYRIWAAGRARAYAAWVRRWPQAPALLGAEDLAWQLAFQV